MTASRAQAQEADSLRAARVTAALEIAPPSAAATAERLRAAENLPAAIREFSGLQLALIEITHWYEAVLFIGMLSLFFAHPLWLGILIALGIYFCEIVLDNVCARTTWQWMLRFSVVLGFCLAMTNIIWLYMKY